MSKRASASSGFAQVEKRGGFQRNEGTARSLSVTPLRSHGGRKEIGLPSSSLGIRRQCGKLRVLRGSPTILRIRPSSGLRKSTSL
jgi:hypothetical protein